MKKTKVYTVVIEFESDDEQIKKWNTEWAEYYGEEMLTPEKAIDDTIDELSFEYWEPRLNDDFNDMDFNATVRVVDIKEII